MATLLVAEQSGEQSEAGGAPAKDLIDFFMSIWLGEDLANRELDGQQLSSEMEQRLGSTLYGAAYPAFGKRCECTG